MSSVKDKAYLEAYNAMKKGDTKPMEDYKAKKAEEKRQRDADREAEKWQKELLEREALIEASKHEKVVRIDDRKRMTLDVDDNGRVRLTEAQADAIARDRARYLIERDYGASPELGDYYAESVAKLKRGEDTGVVKDTGAVRAIRDALLNNPVYIRGNEPSGYGESDSRLIHQNTGDIDVLHYTGRKRKNIDRSIVVISPYSVSSTLYSFEKNMRPEGSKLNNSPGKRATRTRYTDEEITAARRKSDEEYKARMRKAYPDQAHLWT
jgi:hypothetical protein